MAEPESGPGSGPGTGPDSVELVTTQLLRDWALPESGGSKYARGDVVIIGGAAKTPGAVSLSGLGALRVGAGRVQLAVAESVAPALAAGFPEAGVVGLPETGSGSVAGAGAAEVCADLVTDADVVLIGPGLDDGEEASALLDALLPQLPQECALVLDAFALGCMPSVHHRLDGHRGPRVLTPNARELQLLLEDDDSDGDDADLQRASTHYGAVISHQETVAAPDGRLWRVPVGHPGLATAGSGDVLAGVVAGLLARGATAEQAACWGTHLHKVSGERLASEVGLVGFLARELVDRVPGLLTELD